MDVADLRRDVIDRRSELLELLGELVRLETPTGDRDGARALVRHLAGVLRADGWSVDVEPRDEVGDLIAARHPGAGGPTTLLLAHYDTVHPVGTLERCPWRVDGDVVRGPGALDMKAGIAAAVVALRAVEAAGGGARGAVTLLATSDEETGSRASRERIEEEARGHDRVLVLEPSRDDGALKSTRKGVADYHMTFLGKASHAGLAPEAGASALIELAHAALAAAGLADPGLGTTVSPTVARAGHATNVVPDHATLTVDVRVPTLAEAERVEAVLRGFGPRDPRVRVEVTGGLNRPPMEATPGNLALLREAEELAASWGWRVTSGGVGGGSDGNFTSALGVPTLDGLGALGGGAHTLDEHVRVDATLERVALVAALLASAGRVLA